MGWSLKRRGEKEEKINTDEAIKADGTRRQKINSRWEEKATLDGGNWIEERRGKEEGHRAYEECSQGSLGMESEMGKRYIFIF